MPVFGLPRETGFQAMIEGDNGLWQAKVWARFTSTTPAQVRERSGRFAAAVRARRPERIDAAPLPRASPAGRQLDLPAHPRGWVVFLRRTDAAGAVRSPERTFAGDPRWTNRLVRAAFDLAARKIRSYALRRKEPTAQPWLKEVDHRMPKRKSRD